ncbi:MAG TPA: exonuclease domain-containing protein [Pyrinomonadaceae bacterium]|nr:exonuclease domain-containing protein [Pyrinomonadaceae bacterium]
MQNQRALISDCPRVRETVALLRASGGRATAVSVAEEVLQLQDLDPQSAASLVSELVSEDWRVRVSDDGTHEVELLCEDDDCRALDATDYVVVDVEATGSKAPPARVMELGAYRLSGGRIVAEYQTLINPRAPIPAFISNLTGITDAMVAVAPPFEEVACDWLAFADGAVIVAHDADEFPFDVRLINHELSLIYPRKRMANPHLAAVPLSRRVVPGLVNHRLPTLAEHFSVPLLCRHRAAADARATAEVFLRLLELLREHGVSSLGEARKFNLKPARNGNGRAAASRNDSVTNNS